MSVKVAVRVRPFNSREKQLSGGCIVNMDGNKTIIRHNENGRIKDFAFDYSFWSHDGYSESQDGYLCNDGESQYADQQQVFNLVGKEILDNAWEGYHCCLFAYGQTGSGKSYSMIGYGSNKGIVPISCQEIFNRIESNQDKTKEYEVDVSMLEIYNEKIQDLIIPNTKRPPGGLKVREHKLYGIYVEGLTKYKVDSYEAIDRKMDEGTRNRTVGATLMNQTSSRAHTLIRIEFRNIQMIGGKKTEKLSVINLVDLAGSEKLSKTEASGDRMKEGCAINKSLTILGIVISTLAEKASNPKSGKVVPYRDSALTRILQNALGGNSRTLMICAISPSMDNYEESLSTLRYADQAKKIKCNAVINESEQDKMIRSLKEENEKLKKILEEMHSSGSINLQQVREMQNDMQDNADLIEHQMNEQQQQIDQQQQNEQCDDHDCSRLVNLNEDQQLNKKVKYYLQNDSTSVGRKGMIMIGGLGIWDQHGEIIKDQDGYLLRGMNEQCCEYIVVNGQKIDKQGVQLKHNDRLAFGMNYYFIYSHKGMELDPQYNWESAQIEIIDQMQAIKEMEIEKELNQYKQKIDEENQQVKEEIDQMKEEYENKLKVLEEKLRKESMKKEQEREEQQKIQEKKEKEQKKKERKEKQEKKMKELQRLQEQQQIDKITREREEIQKRMENQEQERIQQQQKVEEEEKQRLNKLQEEIKEQEKQLKLQEQQQQMILEQEQQQQEERKKQLEEEERQLQQRIEQQRMMEKQQQEELRKYEELKKIEQQKYEELKKLEQQKIEEMKQKEEEYINRQKQKKEEQKQKEEEEEQIQQQQINEEQQINQEAEQIRHEIRFLEDQEKEIQKTRGSIGQLKQQFESKLGQQHKQVSEMNLMAKALKRNVQLCSKVDYEIQMDQLSTNNLSPYDFRMVIEVENYDSGYKYRWDIDKFNIRYYVVKDLFDEYLMSNVVPILKEKDDPFWDPTEHSLVGTTYVQLLNVPYIIENPCLLEIMGEQEQKGTLQVDTVPTDQTGQINMAEQYDLDQKCIEEPEEMLGQPLWFKMEIGQIILKQTDKQRLTNVYCQYQIMDQNEMMKNWVSKQVGLDDQGMAQMKMGYIHGYDQVDQHILNYLLESQICISIYAIETVPKVDSIQSPSRNSIIKTNRNRKDSQQNTIPMKQEVIKRRSTQLNITRNLLSPFIAHQFQQLKKLDVEQQEQNKKKKKDGCIIF